MPPPRKTAPRTTLPLCPIASAAAAKLLSTTRGILITTGTNVDKRLARGDGGTNPLDSACKTHDIEYLSKDGEDRYQADTKLEEAAAKRILAADASLGERVTAVGVVLAMKAKKALSVGQPGVKRKKRSTPKPARKLKLGTAVRGALKRVKCCKRSKKTRIIETPAQM